MWQLACRLEEIPYVGDYVTYDINDESVIVVRETAERIRAYHNVCQHRGRRLTEGCGTAAKLQCRFHGWQWGLDGQVIRILDRDDWAGCPDMGDEDFALAEVKVDTWAGFVFVNFDPHCEPLAAYLAPVPEYTGCFEFEAMRYRWYKSVRLPCNWKVALEAFSEGYHVFGTHPQLLDSQGDDVTRSFTFGRHGMFGYPTPARLPGAPSPRTGRPIPDDVRPGIVKFFQDLEDQLKAIITERDNEAAKRILQECPADTPHLELLMKVGQFQREAALADGAGWPGITPEQLYKAGHRLARVPEHGLPDVAGRHAVLSRAARRRQPRLLLLRHLLDRALCARRRAAAEARALLGRRRLEDRHRRALRADPLAGLLEHDRGAEGPEVQRLPRRAHQPAAGKRDLEFPSRAARDALRRARGMTTSFDETFDLVIVGSGGGSMCAALVAKDTGPEAADRREAAAGGRLHRLLGRRLVDTGQPGDEACRRGRQPRARAAVPRRRGHLRRPGHDAGAARCVPAHTARGWSSSSSAHGMKFVYADGWSDYYDDLPGGEPRGRSLIAELFDTRELGDWEPRLSRYKGFAMPVPTDQFTDLMLVKRTMKGKRRAAALAWRMLEGQADRRPAGRRRRGDPGPHAADRAARADPPIWTESPVTQLIVEAPTGTGASPASSCERDGKAVRIGARRGVLINVGGFSRNAAMRERFQPQPSSAEWTNANPGDTGEVIEMAMALGAAVDCMDEAWWVVTSLGPDGKPPRPGGYAADGTPLPFMHHLDLSLPYSIMVDQLGERFCDEAGAYMEIGQRMYRRQQATGRAVPSWVVMDSRQRDVLPVGHRGAGPGAASHGSTAAT